MGVFETLEIKGDGLRILKRGGTFPGNHAHKFNLNIITFLSFIKLQSKDYFLLNF